jgi:ABC-type ATPase with predicted acetyltransferase domain
MLTLSLQHEVLSRATPTDRAMDIAVMFGLSLDGTHRHTVLPPIQLTLAPGQTVFVTGTSGGGKSTLLRCIAEAISDACTSEHVGEVDEAQSPGLIVAEVLPTLPDAALVDALARPEGEIDADAKDALPAAPLESVTRWLSLAGLNDAAVMLRTPSQLSEGQRHRLRLAQAMAVAERSAASWTVLLIDEFGSTLDRTTAFALARGIRRWVAKSRVCLVCATTHDDLLEPLMPDTLVEVAPGGRCEVHTRAQ